MDDNTYTLGPDRGTLQVRTYREGFGAKVGHDLVLEVTRWSATVSVSGADVTASSFTATADSESIRVSSGTGGVKPLSDKDKDDIHKNMRDKVLNAGKHPQITARSTAIRPTAGGFAVEGELSIVGTTRPFSLELSKVTSAQGDRLTGTLSIVQSDFGIKPFSALLGALKVRDALDVDIDVAVPESSLVGAA